jgi:hypothetical protein
LRSLADTSRARPLGAPLPSGRELLLATVLLGVLAAATYARHVARGGWYYDDWAWIGTLSVAEPGLGGLYEAARTETHRPLFAATMCLLYLVGGEGQAPYLVAGAGIAAAQGALAYAVLRLARIGAALAVPLAAMLVVLPVIDATRLWTAALPVAVAVCLLLAGTAVALLGVRTTGPSAVALHAGALVLYAAAILTYELVAPVVGLAALLYVAAAGRRAALVRWPADVVVAGLSLLAISDAAEERRDVTLDLAHIADRAGDMLAPSRDVFGALFPLEAVLHGPAGVALLLAGAVGAVLALRRGEAAAAAIRQWLLVAVIGLLAAAAGLAGLLPADAYYVPRLTGVGDRISAVAALGALALLVALVWLVAFGLASLVRRPSAAMPIAVAALLVTAAGLVRDELRNQDAWAASWIHSQEVVGAVRESVGTDAPSGAGVVTLGHADRILPDDVPVFADVWDLRGAMRLLWDDPDATGYRWPGGGVCTRTALDLGAPGEDAYRLLPYGRLWFVYVPVYRARRIDNRSDCERAVADAG